MMYDHYYKVSVKTECRPSVVDDITVKHTVLDGINAKLQRIDQSLIGIQINQGKTIREAELEKLVDTLEEDNAIAHRTIAELRKKILPIDVSFLNDEGLIEKYQCGGSNKYKTIKTGVASHAEMTATVRTNIQEIANGNGQLDQYGYMFGKWIKKNADSYFLSGLFKALSEGG